MVTMEGRKALSRKLQRMPKAIREAISDTLLKSATELVAMQKRMAPRDDSGGLRASIRHENNPTAEGYGVLVIAGGTPATRRELRKGSGKFSDVAVFTEFGTEKHRNKGLFAGSLHPGTTARPFFYPIYRALKKRINSRTTRDVRKAIKTLASGK
jgi:hypothetical protein